MKQIPNIFTLLNLVFGCLAIVAILQNGIVISTNEEGNQLLAVPEKIWMASLFIAIAGIVDFLDGFIARLLKANSDMGKQLDSLADVVSFGVAPSLIVYQFLRLSIAKEEDGLDASFIWLMPAFLIAAAGAYRLARFNIATDQEYGFKGVPIPAVGLLIASFPLIYWGNSNETVLSIFTNKWVWYTVILLVSGLMISQIPMMAMKFKDRSIKNNLPKIILVLVAILAALILHWIAVPVVFLVYIILSLLFKQ